MSAPERDLGPEPSAASGSYITEISAPSLGDGGVQRLRSYMREPEPLPELETEVELEAGI